MTSTHRRILACIAVAAIASSGCGGSGDAKAARKAGSAPPDTEQVQPAGQQGEGRSAQPAKAPKAEGVDAPAAQLRATLTDLLVQHVYLTGLAAEATGSGLTGPAAGVLDQNSVALAGVFGGVYGAPAGQQFLDQWRRQIGAVLDQARAKAAGDKARVDKGKADLERSSGDLATLLNGLNPHMFKDVVGDDLKAYLGRFSSAVQAQGTKDPSAPGKLKQAAKHMPQTAVILAGAIVKDKPEAFPGSVDGGAATLWATLAAALDEHVYLVRGATAARVAGPDPKPASVVLEDNTVELGNVFGSAYGDAASLRFLNLWRRHIDAFLRFAEATRAHDRAGMDAARADLDRYRQDFAAFVHGANRLLAEDDVADDVKVHVDSMLAALEPVVAGAPSQFPALREAAAHMPMTAKVLAGGISQQFKTKFG